MTILVSANTVTAYDQNNKTSSAYLYIKNSIQGKLSEQSDTKSSLPLR